MGRARFCKSCTGRLKTADERSRGMHQSCFDEAKTVVEKRAHRLELILGFKGENHGEQADEDVPERGTREPERCERGVEQQRGRDEGAGSTETGEGR